MITILDRLDEARRAGLATLAGMLIAKNLPVFLLAAAPPERSRNGLPLNPLLARYAGLDAAVFRQAFDIIMDSAWQMPVV